MFSFLVNFFSCNYLQAIVDNNYKTLTNLELKEIKIAWISSYTTFKIT